MLQDVRQTRPTNGRVVIASCMACGGIPMSIAVDQQRLRRIVDQLLPSRTLERSEATTMLQFVQLAAGVDRIDDPVEHSIMQSVAQTVCGLAGLRTGDLLAIPPLNDDLARMSWLRRLGRQLPSRGARELTYALVFLMSVADLVLTSAEREALEEFQHALDIDHERATALIVLLTDTVAASEDLGQRPSTARRV